MKTALICVSFGTSVPSARKSIELVENALRKELPQADFFRVFTSSIIRRKLAAQREVIWSMQEALQALTGGEYDRILVQPTHFLYGYEYENIRDCVQEAKKQFPAITLGVPLLSNTADVQQLAEILNRAFPQKQNGAVVFMGHGSEHFANVVYLALQAAFHMMGRKDMFVGTVEGWPEVEDVLEQIQQGGYANVQLAPLMLVAGDHALNDMAGEEEDSWKSVLAMQGLSVECFLQGMGMNPEIQQMYCRHLNELL